ncbi:MAG: sigma-70 family RNA polymerase sigma factor [Chloroflexi bacterium]|nr:sigma-70 family RNA polymerase sigma factor [Chloroflexota bacterium]
MDQEKVWVSQILAGDQAVFAQLIEAYKNPVYNLCYRMLGTPMEAEDAAQETFLRVYSRLHSYDPKRKLSSWVLSIASHYCIDRLRRRRMHTLSWDEIARWGPTTCESTHPEEGMRAQEERDQIARLLSILPANYRLVLVLRYWEDLSYTEIAEITGSTESAVKSRLHRAREMLAQRIIAEVPDYHEDSKEEHLLSGISRMREEEVVRNALP